MDCTNAPDFSDYNTFLYGHNMKNGTMFGLLKRYKKIDYYQENPVFWLYTTQGKFKYQIFSCYVTSAIGTSYTNHYPSVKAYQSYLDDIKKCSIYDTGISPSAEGKIISLSTCTSTSEDGRFLVHAMLVEKIENESAE